MRKSSSAPCLSTLGHNQTSMIQHSRKMVVASATPPMAYVFNDVWEHVKVEAMLGTTVINISQCLTVHDFPSDIIDLHPHKNNTSNNIKEVALCLATPPEAPEHQKIVDIHKERDYERLVDIAIRNRRRNQRNKEAPI